MTIILAKQEKVSYLKLSYVLYDSLESRVAETDGSRSSEFVDKCDSTVRDRVWLFSSFGRDGYRVYNTIIDNLVNPLKDVSLNHAIGIVNDICRFTDGSPDYRALIIDEFSQGGLIDVISGKATSCDTFVQYPIEEGCYAIERVLKRFDILSHILNADIPGLKDKDIYKGSGLDKFGLRGRLMWALIQLIKRRSPVFMDRLIETAFNNNFVHIFKDILGIILSATGELSIEIKKVIDRIEDPLNRLFDFPLYGKFILSSYNNGYLQNYVHNMNSPFKVGSGFKIEGTPHLTILVLDGSRYLE